MISCLKSAGKSIGEFGIGNCKCCFAREHGVGRVRFVVGSGGRAEAARIEDVRHRLGLEEGGASR